MQDKTNNVEQMWSKTPFATAPNGSDLRRNGSQLHRH
jgi:hypothetical protein